MNNIPFNMSGALGALARLCFALSGRLMLSALAVGVPAVVHAGEATSASRQPSDPGLPRDRVLKYEVTSSQALRNIRNFVAFQLEVAEKHDVTRLDDLVAPAMIVHSFGPGSIMAWLQGAPQKERVLDRAFFRDTDAFANLQDHKIVIEEVYGIGDVVVARWRIEGLGKGPLFGVQTAGKKVLTHETGFMRYDDMGRMAEGTFTIDGAELFLSLGVPAPVVK
ncbi:hypothetical protein ASE00_21045 [Sphingomonas sp. Root710]|uniref:ester cyclase n=1 Tax=Sphingomonas sp. Root710 TaxID=1736594 RepID=UPI0006FE6C27|nr:ester cyclase [Sphingomonas sp. Root710]KRB78866.1 hypothetical protein ASE00_21045 [Sphingomonas sp. Root710]